MRRVDVALNRLRHLERVVLEGGWLAWPDLELLLTPLVALELNVASL